MSLFRRGAASAATGSGSGRLSRWDTVAHLVQQLRHVMGQSCSLVLLQRACGIADGPVDAARPYSAAVHVLWENLPRLVSFDGLQEHKTLVVFMSSWREEFVFLLLVSLYV